MFEETNQTPELEDNLFDAEEETTEPAENEPGEAGEAGEAGEEAREGQISPESEAAQEVPKIKVKYMGEERELAADELVIAAQKGLDYDRIRQERDQLKNSPEITALDQFAQAAGMTRQGLIQYLQNQEVQEEIAAQVRQGVPEPMARKLYEYQKMEQEQQAREAAEAEKSRQKQLYMELTREYPDIKELPDEVKAAIKAGETPLSAYRGYELRQLRAQMAAKEQTAKNRAASLGPAAGDAPPEDVDGFLSGFESAFR